MTMAWLAYFLVFTCTAIVSKENGFFIFVVIPVGFCIMTLPFAGAWYFAAAAMRRKPTTAIIVALAMTPIHLFLSVQDIFLARKILAVVPTFWDRLSGEPRHDADQVVRLVGAAVFSVLDLILIAALIFALIRRTRSSFISTSI
jgi:hypothetical protein